MSVSYSDYDDDDDALDGAGRAPVVGPRYAGQDRRPTSAKELLGWYAYAFAAETYPVCGSFLDYKKPFKTRVCARSTVQPND
jgi:hypothetical protein